MILVILQNAWFDAPLGPQEWSDHWRYIWMYATAKSRTGQRLKVMLGPDCFERGRDGEAIVFDEANRQVAYGNSGGKFPADFAHLEALLAEHAPRVVVACGAEAAKVAALWGGPLVEVPHPAHRTVTNQLFRQAGSLVKDQSWRGRVRFRMTLSTVSGENNKVYDVIQEPHPVAAPQRKG